MPFRVPLIITLLISSLLVPVSGFQQPAATDTFEVASVKPNRSGDARTRISLAPNGRFTATGMPLRFLITFIYEIQDFQLFGAPDWLASDRFDFAASAARDVTPAQMRQMIRALLAERFGLVVRNDTKEMPVYALILARRDGRLGPKLTASATACAPPPGARRGNDAPAALTPGLLTGRPECGVQLERGPTTKIIGGSAPISQLVTMLAPFVGRTVQDKTGLTGPFDLELSWTPETTVPPTGAAEPPDVNGASIFTAIQEQLGLKLEPQHGPADVLVIDRVSQPTPD